MANSQMSDEQLSLLLKKVREWLAASDAKAAKDIAMRRGGRAKKKRRQYASGGAPGSAPPSAPQPQQQPQAPAQNAGQNDGGRFHMQQMSQMPQANGFRFQQQPVQMPQPLPVQTQQATSQAYPGLRVGNEFGNYFMNLFNGGQNQSMRPGGLDGRIVNMFQSLYGFDNAGPGWGTRYWNNGGAMAPGRENSATAAGDMRQRADGGRMNDATHNALRIARGMR